MLTFNHNREANKWSIPRQMTYAVWQQDTKKKISRDSSPRLHVSALLNRQCATYYWFNSKYPEENLESAFSCSQQAVWKQGRSTESHVREQLIQASEDRKIKLVPFGAWACDCGSFVQVATGKPKKALCKACLTPFANYKEYDLIDEVNGLQGHPDLVLVKDGKYYIVEIKSCDQPYFEKYRDKNTAEVKHIQQASIYAHMLRAEGYNVASSAFIFYVNKRFSKEQPYFVYEFNVDDEKVVTYVNNYMALAQKITKKRFEDSPPERVKCKTREDAEKKRCPYRDRCFTHFPESVADTGT